jgi:hypothetical protein
MKHLHHLVAVAVAATGLSVVGFSTPAQAVTAVQVDVQESTITVQGNACKSGHAVVTGDWNQAGQSGNVVTVNLYDPSHDLVAQLSMSDEDTGSVDFEYDVCGGSETPGVYTVEAVATTTYADSSQNTTATGSDTFTLKRIHAKKSSHLQAKLMRTKDRVYKWAAVGKLTRGSRAYTHQKVWLQARDHGEWKSIAKTRTLKKGMFGWYLKPNPLTWRFYFAGNRTTKADTSKTFRTPHRHGRVVLGTDPSSFVRG